MFTYDVHNDLFPYCFFAPTQLCIIFILSYDLSNPFQQSYSSVTHTYIEIRIHTPYQRHIQYLLKWQAITAENVSLVSASATSTTNTICHCWWNHFVLSFFSVHADFIIAHIQLASLSLSLALASGSQCVIKQLQERKTKGDTVSERERKRANHQQTEKLFNASNVSLCDTLSTVFVSFFTYLTHCHWFTCTATGTSTSYKWKRQNDQIAINNDATKGNRTIEMQLWPFSCLRFFAKELFSFIRLN